MLIDRLIQMGIVDEEGRFRRALREELVDLYGPVLDGFDAVSARLSPSNDPSPQRHSGWIDKGSQDGIEPGLGVVGAHGVIGKIGTVSKKWARVVLADDPSFRIAFRNEEGKQGIAAGGPGDGEVHPILRMESMDIDEGELLVTHGADGKFPPAVILGVVGASHLPIDRSRVRLPSGFDAPQEVLVLVPGQVILEGR